MLSHFSNFSIRKPLEIMDPLGEKNSLDSTLRNKVQKCFLTLTEKLRKNHKRKVLEKNADTLPDN
jgi:hypothetical protein